MMNRMKDLLRIIAFTMSMTCIRTFKHNECKKDWYYVIMYDSTEKKNRVLILFDR